MSRGGAAEPPQRRQHGGDHSTYLIRVRKLLDHYIDRSLVAWLIEMEQAVSIEFRDVSVSVRDRKSGNNLQILKGVSGRVRRCDD